jgi:hypothetical protein
MASRITNRSLLRANGMKHRAKRKHKYWRVVIVYIDNETSGNRVFNDLDRAKRWAERQEKSNVVKKFRIEPFIREPYRWRERRSE